MHDVIVNKMPKSVDDIYQNTDFCPQWNSQTTLYKITIQLNAVDMLHK